MAAASRQFDHVPLQLLAISQQIGVAWNDRKVAQRAPHCRDRTLVCAADSIRLAPPGGAMSWPTGSTTCKPFKLSASEDSLSRPARRLSKMAREGRLRHRPGMPTSAAAVGGDAVSAR
jgi:hypothetical protein